ncbi:MAG: PD-(D/E)XK nuclease family transposase, partial [Lachnospiraceae bacterium]|nr:PD-(D/E)XK nuclease family transposase [Lachnospiraceae bacterium]
MLLKKPIALKGLLAAILGIKGEDITEIRYLDTNTLKETPDDKLSILDLFIELQDGNRYNLEMQMSFFEYWENRTLVNIFRKFLEPIKSGDKNENDNLPKCIHIGILNFICKKEEPDFYNYYEILNRKTGHLYSDRVAFHMIELPKLITATEEEKR